MESTLRCTALGRSVLLCLGPMLMAAAPPPPLLPGGSGGTACTLAPGAIREFWVTQPNGDEVDAGAVTWSLSGPGQIALAPGNARCEYRAPRPGGKQSLLTATSVLDPTQQVVFTLTGKPNPAPPAPPKVDLQPGFSYDLAERNQGSCSDCYAWATTAALELELHRHYGIQDRLSIQYFHSIYRPLATDAPTDPCCANNFSALLEHTKLAQRMIPWANPNADFKDRSSRCGVDRPAHEPIGLLPNYRVRDLTSQQLETKLWSNEDVIEELKQVLSQGRAIISKIGGHYVTLVGYEASDPDPLKHHWRVLDSARPASAGPVGGYTLPMRPVDYNLLDGPNEYHYQFDYLDRLDLELQAPGLPPTSVWPAKADLMAGQPLSLVASAGGRPPVRFEFSPP